MWRRPVDCELGNSGINFVAHGSFVISFFLFVLWHLRIIWLYRYSATALLLGLIFSVPPRKGAVFSCFFLRYMWTLDVEQASLSWPKAVQPGPPRQASQIDWLKLMETDSFIYFLRRWHLRKCSPQQGVAEAGQKALSPNTTWGSPQTISSKVITLPPPFSLTFPSSSVHAPHP